MRSILLVCACVAAQMEHSFSGSFTLGEPTLYDVQLDSAGACYNDSSSYYTRTFNYTFATAGVRALYTYNLYAVSVVDSSMAYDLLNQCVGGNVVPLTYNSYGPISDMSYYYAYGHYFQAKQYTFIVSGYYEGGFVGEIWNGIQGQTMLGGTNQTWKPVTGDASSCTQSSYTYLYDTKVVSVATSGYYDIFVTFARNSALGAGYQLPYGHITYSILGGNWSGVDLGLQNCSSANLITSSDNYGYNLNLQTYNTWLAAGTPYTFVVQSETVSDQVYYGKYALTVTPSIYVQYSNTTLFTPPSSSSYCGSSSSGCTTSTAVENAFVKFSVAADSYFAVFQNQQFSQDLVYYIYDGDNTLLRAGCPAALFSCIGYIDTYGSVYYSGTSTTITVASTPYSSNYGSDGVLSLVILRGPNIAGSGISSAPTNAGSSNAPTNAGSSAAPTNAGSSAAPTNAGSSAAPTNAGSSTAPTTKSNTTTAPGTKASSAPTPKTDVSSVNLVVPLFTVFSFLSLLW